MSLTTVGMANRDSIPGLSALLRAAREKAGMSQVEAGKAAGVHHVSIAKFETDARTPTLRILCKLARAYGVDPRTLIPPQAN